VTAARLAPVPEGSGRSIRLPMHRRRISASARGRTPHCWRAEPSNGPAAATHIPFAFPPVECKRSV
jgi:hypothetical protein